MTVVGLQWVQSTDTYSCPAADSIQGGGATPIPATRVAGVNEPIESAAGHEYVSVD